MDSAGDRMVKSVAKQRASKLDKVSKKAWEDETSLYTRYTLRSITVFIESK
jgi:hypothetical protein